MLLMSSRQGEYSIFTGTFHSSREELLFHIIRATPSRGILQSSWVFFVPPCFGNFHASVKTRIDGKYPEFFPACFGNFHASVKIPIEGKCPGIVLYVIIIVPPCFGNLHASVKIPVDGNQTVKLQNDLSHHPPEDFCLPSRKACRLGASCVSCPAYCRIWCIWYGSTFVGSRVRWTSHGSLPRLWSIINATNTNTSTLLGSLSSKPCPTHYAIAPIHHSRVRNDIAIPLVMTPNGPSNKPRPRQWNVLANTQLSRTRSFMTVMTSILFAGECSVSNILYSATKKTANTNFVHTQFSN